MKLSAKAALLCGLAVELFVFVFFYSIGERPLTALSSAKAGSRPLVLLDAGHGGEDGGACGEDGTLEKDVNVAITNALGDLLSFCGCRVSYTRTDDRSIGEGDTVRERKVSDMHARLALYDAADLAISVHQNKFGSASCRGAQFFYGAVSPESRVLAETMRSQFVTLLQPDNTRELKPGGDNVFLLYKTVTPAVLAECGFLSNPDELCQLKTDAYRKSVAFALAAGILQYLS